MGPLIVSVAILGLGLGLLGICIWNHIRLTLGDFSQQWEYWDDCN